MIHVRRSIVRVGSFNLVSVDSSFSLENFFLEFLTMKHENGLTKKNRSKITTANESLAIAAFACHADAASGQER